MNPTTGVLSEAWALYRRYASHFLTIAFLIYVVTAVIVALLTAFAGLAGLFLAVVIDLIAAFLVQAALVRAVQDVQDGRVDLNLRETVSAALPFLVPVGLASIVAGIGIAIGFGLIIVPGLILLTFWSLIVPSIVVGGAGPMASFGVSWRTVRGYAWPVFGIYLLVFLIWIAFSIVLALILLPVPAGVRGFLSAVITGTVVAPFLALVVTLLYYRLSAAHRGGTGQPADRGYPPPSAPGYPPPPAPGGPPPPAPGGSPPPRAPGGPPPPGPGGPVPS
jgi:hypothetical protein